MKNISIVFLALFGLILFSCNDNKHEPEELEVETVDNSPEAVKTYEVAKVDAEFSDPKVEAVFNQYLQVQNALINTDAEKTSTEAGKMKSLLEEVSADERMKQAASNMANTEEIRDQRQDFQDLSAGMEKLLEGSLKSGTLYKQYCPMAFDNQGGYWISSGRDVLNPYFGDKMLKCGRVEAEIK